MSILREIPPTAGFPISGRDFFSLLNPGSRKGSLEEDFKNYLEVIFTRLTNSGTAAIYLILEAMKNLSSKKTVLIPSYICPLVPLAIKRAGLKLKVCDINKDNFNFDISQLKKICSENSDILSIVCVHLAGLPVDMDTIKEIALKNNIFTVEDCAQSLGAEYKGKKTGALGDFSFFSLARGKGLTIYEGGIIVTNKEEYASGISSTIDTLVKDALFSESLKKLELLGYWLFYNPYLFWFAFRLPQIFWNLRGQPLRAQSEYFTARFPVHRVSGSRSLIGHINFYRLENEIASQRQKASFYIEALGGIKGIRIIKEAAFGKATYPYLTLVFDDPEKRKVTKESLEKLGLGVYQIYPLAIGDYDYLKDIIENSDFPNARYLAEREITLSTNTFLKKKDLDSIVGAIKKLS